MQELNTENCDTGEILKTKNTPKFVQRMYQNLLGVKAGRASMPVQRRIPIHSLLNFLFLKT